MTKEQATDILIRYTNDGEGIFIEGDTDKIKEALSMAIYALAGCNSDHICNLRRENDIPTGHWITHYSDRPSCLIRYITCSECDDVRELTDEEMVCKYRPNYCESCGAKMEE